MGVVATVGSFDGVHLGHVHLLDVLKERARAAGGESVVVTFSAHPRRNIDPSSEIRELTSADQKWSLIAAQGIDRVVVLPFDEATRAMTAEEFVCEILVGRLAMEELVVGYNHRLGRDRSGDAEMLRELGRQYGFRVFEASEFALAGVEKVSSSAIRQALASGDIALAEKMLGRKITG